MEELARWQKHDAARAGRSHHAAQHARVVDLITWKETSVNPLRRTAFVAGLLFIITFVASIQQRSRPTPSTAADGCWVLRHVAPPPFL